MQSQKVLSEKFDALKAITFPEKWKTITKNLFFHKKIKVSYTLFLQENFFYSQQIFFQKIQLVTRSLKRAGARWGHHQ
jgi:hypothetical protein